MGRITALTNVSGAKKDVKQDTSVMDYYFARGNEHLYRAGWAPWAARADYMGNSVSFDVHRAVTGDYVDCDAIAWRKSETIRAYRAQAWRVLSELDGVSADDDVQIGHLHSEAFPGAGRASIDSISLADGEHPVGGGSIRDQVYAQSTDELLDCYAHLVNVEPAPGLEVGTALDIDSLSAHDRSELLDVHGQYARVVVTDELDEPSGGEHLESVVAMATAGFGASNSDILGCCYARNLPVHERRDAVRALGKWPSLGRIRHYVDRGGSDSILDGIVVSDGLFLHVLSDTQVDGTTSARLGLRTLRDEVYHDDWRVGGIATNVAVAGLVVAAGAYFGTVRDELSLFDSFLLHAMGKVPLWDDVGGVDVHYDIPWGHFGSLRDNTSVRLMAQQAYQGDTCLALHCISDDGIYDLRGHVDGRIVLSCAYATNHAVTKDVDWRWYGQPGVCAVRAVVPGTVGTVVYLRLSGSEPVDDVPFRSLLRLA